MQREDLTTQMKTIYNFANHFDGATRSLIPLMSNDELEYITSRFICRFNPYTALGQWI